MSAEVAVESLPERLARQAARSVDAMDVEDLRTREDEIARVCAAAIRQALYEAVTAVLAKRDGKSMLNPGLEAAAAAIEALK